MLFLKNITKYLKKINTTFTKRITYNRGRNTFQFILLGQSSLYQTKELEKKNYYRPKSSITLHAKVLKIISANRIQLHIKRIISPVSQ